MALVQHDSVESCYKYHKIALTQFTDGKGANFLSYLLNRSKIRHDAQDNIYFSSIIQFNNQL